MRSRRALFAAVLAAASLPAPAQQSASPGLGPVAVEVRMMSDAELHARYDVEALSGTAAGVFSLPRSLTAAVSTAGNAPSTEGPPGTFGYNAHRDVVMGMIGRAVFPIQLDGALRQRLGAIAKPDGIPAHLAVAIGFYGLQSRDASPTMLQEGDDFCFVFRAVAVFERSGQPVQEQKVERGMAALSAGMAGPRCAPMRDLAGSGGGMLREFMRDAAEAAADWIVVNIVQAQ